MSLVGDFIFFRYGCLILPTGAVKTIIWNKVYRYMYFFICLLSNRLFQVHAYKLFYHPVLYS